MTVKVGEHVPDLTIEAYQAGQMKRIKMSDFRGKWVVLFFYPLDFTFVCPTEIKGFAKRMNEFKKLGAVVMGASTDSAHSHKAWVERDMPEVKYPLLADTNHKLSNEYGVLVEDSGIALRGTFIIDKNGILQYSVISNLNVGRSVEETLRVLQACQT